MKRSMNWAVFLLIGLFPCTMALTKQGSDNYSLLSPDKNIEIQVNVGQKIHFSVLWKNERVINYAPISMTLGNTIWGDSPYVVSCKSEEVNQLIKTVHGSRKEINDRYNQISLNFKGNYSLIFRAYDKGIAYRFVGDVNNDLTILDEELGLKLSGITQVWEPQSCSYETDWKLTGVSEMEKGKKLYLPLLFNIKTGNGTKVKLAVTEADLTDYPSLFLSRSATFENEFNAVFEKYPLSTKIGGFNNFMHVPDKVANFIAKTKGERGFPWRVFVITDDDRDLVDNDLVFCLSAQQKLKDTECIQPGQVLWDWWHDYNIEGVDFETGINNETYRYQIDFASQHGIPYVNIDWKWSDFKNLMLPNPDVDVPKLVEYANQKNVKLIVWCISYTLEEQMEEAMDMFSDWGVAAIKVDFFGRDDQLVVNLHERIAQCAADHKLMVNFHGCSKPAGLQRTYPNIMNFEAVLGSEANKWNENITPDHDLNVAFIRQICGSMDYTPGAMSNSSKGRYHVTYPPGSQGTRCHQLAMYVVYPQPFAMLCDMPTAYAKEPEYFDILKSIPSSWDDTKVLLAEAGEYVVVARRKGNDWYIGAMTNWEERELYINLSFLDEGTYSATMVVDGANANKLAIDHRINQKQFSSDEKPILKLKQGGGAFIKLEKN